MNKSTVMTSEFLEAILGTIDEAIHAIDVNGNTIYYNEVAARHDGLKMEEVIGKPLLQIFPSLNEKTSTLLNVIKHKKPVYHKAQSIINLHGRIIETVNTTLPVWVNGDLAGAVEVAKDYTQIKELARRLTNIGNAGAARGGAMKPGYRFCDIHSKNEAFAAIKSQAEKLAASPSSMLIYGESGTGKELFVHAIHASSGRTGPLVAQNCAAIPEALLESILFGTVKGSFTGAVDRPGLFELADGGSLFLDELHSMPYELQAKLLRVLEDGAIRRVGGTSERRADVRIMAAMNIPPAEALNRQLIREDLFYRVSVIPLELPPLRKRIEDILFLANRFIAELSGRLGKVVKGIDSDVSRVFLAYHWPGNVRELKHAVEYMVNVCEYDCLTLADLPPYLKDPELPEGPQKNGGLKERMKAYEDQLIKEALTESGGNIKKAAALLKIPRQTLQYKLRRHESVDEE